MDRMALRRPAPWLIVHCNITCAAQHRALCIDVAAHLGRFLPNLGRPPGRPLFSPSEERPAQDLDEALADVVQLLADDTPSPSATAIMPFPATGQATGNATSGPTSC